MSKTALAISIVPHDSDSAYQYRIRKLADLLEEHGVACEFFYTPETWPLNTVTSGPIFMPFWLGQLRKYKYIYCGAPIVGQYLYLCHTLIPGVITLDMHGDDISQSSQENQIRSGNPSAGPLFLNRLQYSMALRAADYILTQSEWHKSDLTNAGLKPDRISVIRNGVDLDLFQPLPLAENPQFTFGYAGEFQTWQGIDDLISGFEMVSDPRIRMLLIGFRKSDQKVKQIFSEKFGNRVELVDRTDRKNMLELLSSASILISPRPNHVASRAAFPVKFAEYAALGRPILVNAVDETADFVKKYDCGFVCATPIPRNMAHTMDMAASSSRDTLIQMGLRSRRMAEENFSWPKVGDAYASLVKSLIDKNHAKELKASGIFSR
jgi:glycosyltransferase involved in cell wall biosynthesis